MPNRILALDPHGAQLVAVVVETSFRSYQVVGFFAEPRDPNAPLFGPAALLRSPACDHGRYRSVGTAGTGGDIPHPRAALS